MPKSKHPICRMDITVNMPSLVFLNEDMDDYENNDRYAVNFMKCALEEIFELDCKKYVFQLECSKKGNLHYQCRVSLNTKKRTINYLNHLYREISVRLAKSGMDFEFSKCHIHISPTQNITKDFDYVMKSESKVKGYTPSTNLGSAELEPIKIPDFQELPEWGQFIWEEWIEKQSKWDSYGRKILFCIDKTGGLGKTTFVKWLCYKNKKDVLKVDNFASDANFSKPVITAGAKKAYVMDLPRTLVEYSRSNKYNNTGWAKFSLMLETLKDGFLQSSMNGHRLELIMNSPAVIVFTNSPPPKNVLSQDRVVLWDLNNQSINDFKEKNLIEPNVPIFS